jgi:hypothetical protein
MSYLTKVTAAVFLDGRGLCIIALAGLTPHFKVDDHAYLRPFSDDIPLMGSTGHEDLIRHYGEGPHRITDITPDGILLERFEERVDPLQLYGEATPITTGPQEKPARTQGGICFQIPYDTTQIHRPTDGFQPGMRVTHREFPLSGTVTACYWHYVEVRTGGEKILFEPRFLQVAPT